MRTVISALPLLFAAVTGCNSGPHETARSDGPLGSNDLPADHSTQVTSIEALAFEDEWKTTERRYTTLNASGDPLEVVFIMDHPTRAFDTAITYSYDDRGRLQRMTTWHWKKNRGWVEIGRVDTMYDEQNRPIEERASSVDAEGWIDSRLVQYGYDHPDGAVTRVINVPRYDDEGMPDHTGSGATQATMWRNDRMEEQYSSGGQVDSVLTYSWIDGQWQVGTRSVYVYSVDSVLTETITYRRGTHTWVPFLRTTYSEATEGGHVALIHNRRGTEWVVTRRESTRQSS